MTTPAPPCALLTAVTGATKAGKSARAGRPLERRPAYTVLNTVLWRGRAAPPFEPPASRAAPGAAGGRGRRPRTPARMRSRLSGAPLWSPPASRGRAKAPFGERQALRLPDALAPDHEVWSRLLHPPCRRVRSLPAGITRAAGAGWERPRTRQKGRQKPPVAGPSIRRMEGGRSQPHSPPKKRRLRFARMRMNRSSANGFRERRCVRGTAKGAAKGGGCPFAAKRRPRKLRNRRTKRCSAEAGGVRSSTARRGRLASGPR